MIKVRTNEDSKEELIGYLNQLIDRVRKCDYVDDIECDEIDSRDIFHGISVYKQINLNIKFKE